MCCVTARSDGPPFADADFVPPQPVKSSSYAPSSALSPEEVSRYLGSVKRFHVFTTFEGETEALRAEHLQSWVDGGRQGALQGGEVAPVDLAGDALLGPAADDGGAFLWAAGISSIDAEAIRFHVDLSKLPADAQVWVIDPAQLQAFGPYSSGDNGAEQRWLATIFGEEGVLLVRTHSPEVPDIRVVEYAHIFLSFKEAAKNLSCNVNIDCETDQEILSVATGTAIIMVAGGWYCSGTLVNNELTAEHEPFFLTANHCVCTGQNARDTEAYWDYRTSSCDANDPPEMDSLPRSRGTALLATSSKLDTTLIRLDSVSTGAHGRTYVGWDTRELHADESVFTIHYPDITQMRITKGTIRATNIQQSGREMLVKTRWDEGVTEAGSSGAPLLLGDNNRIAGALSLGPQHTCGSNRSGNVDFFGSFRDFYPQISKYIDTSTPSTEEGQDDCREKTTGCFLTTLFNNNPALLDGFRVLRDKLLASGSFGQWVVEAYYAAGPRWACAVRESELARGVCIVATAPLARVGTFLDEAGRVMDRFIPDRQFDSYYDDNTTFL